MSEQWVPTYKAANCHVQMPHRLEPTWECFALPVEAEDALEERMVFDRSWRVTVVKRREQRTFKARPRPPKQPRVPVYKDLPPPRYVFTSYVGLSEPHTIFTTPEKASRVCRRLASMGMVRVKPGVWCKSSGRVRIVRFFKMEAARHPTTYTELFKITADIEAEDLYDKNVSGNV